MSAVLIGSLASGGKILRRSQRSTDVDGLVTLVETYTIRSQDIESIEPDRNTTYNAFTGTTTYSRMLVETTRVEPLDGGFAQLVVTYVGLDYASGLPPAYITTVGQPGVGVFGADAAVVVRYITQDSLFDTLKGGNISLNLGGTSLTLPTKRLMPASINGTTLPSNPRPREYSRGLTGAEILDNAAKQFLEYSKNNPIGIGNFYRPPILGYIPEVEWIYAGYVQTGLSLQRRGIFNQIEEQFTEYFRATDQFYQTDGTINISRVNSFRDRIYSF
jgi:hypothetical protein